MALKKPEPVYDEYEIFSEYRKTKDIGLRDKIIESYMYIAEILSRKFINRGIEYDDIYQVASMGVLYAVERFDPDREVKFATFATPTVMGEIRNYFRDKGSFIKIPRRLYEMFYKAEKIRRGCHSEISSSEIARILNISENDMKQIEHLGDSAFIKSLEYEAYADGELTLSNVIGTEDNSFLMLENKDFVNYCMECISQRERDFITYRYDREMSQQEIADIFGISQMQVSRMEKSLLKKLKSLYFRE